MDTADIVIVGGGIVGSAVAYFLGTDAAAAGRRIVMIERDAASSQGSTGRSAGGVRQQFSTRENIAMSQFTLEVFRSLQARFGAGADVGFREQGYLLLATAESFPILEDNVALQQSMHADIVLVPGSDLPRRFPWLITEGIGGGGFGQRGEGWFDPPSLAALFRKAAQGHGLTILKDDVIGIEAGQCVEAVRLASGGRIACGTLVNAAGPWAGQLAKLAGIDLPVEPRKRFVYVIDCRHATDALRRAPLTVDPSGVWFRPEGNLFLCGLSPDAHREPPAADLDAIDHAWFEAEVWPRLAARVRVFESVKVVNAWAGYYDTNRLDHNAVIGAHPGLTNFYFANGFSGHGAQQAAATGRAIAELILHGAFKTLDLTRLGYARIGAGQPLLERNVI